MSWDTHFMDLIRICCYLEVKYYVVSFFLDVTVCIANNPKSNFDCFCASYLEKYVAISCLRCICFLFSVDTEMCFML